MVSCRIVATLRVLSDFGTNEEDGFAFAHWVTNGLDHVFSTPLEDQLKIPPAIGFQSFTATTSKSGQKAW